MLAVGGCSPTAAYLKANKMVKQIRGVHHIVLTVSDLKRSSTFYEWIIGVKSGANVVARWISCDL